MENLILCKVYYIYDTNNNKLELFLDNSFIHISMNNPFYFRISHIINYGHSFTIPLSISNFHPRYGWIFQYNPSDPIITLTQVFNTNFLSNPNIPLPQNYFNIDLNGYTQLNIFNIEQLIDKFNNI